MKRAGGLWPEVIAFESLYRAAYEVLRGKRDRAEAGAFFTDLEGQLLTLQRELTAHTYVPGEYRTFWIADPKPRLISAAPFRDRVVHHALVNAIEPVFERRFIHHSYACRTGKGNHRALGQLVRWSRASRFVLKLDVNKFFPSIDHAVLKRALRQAVKDAEVLWLCDLIIDGSNPQEPVVWHFAGDDLLAPLGRRRGIPIGNLTSQFFGNVYLDAIDHEVTDRLGWGRYLRYVDDLCVFGDDKVRLRELRARIKQALARARLRLNEGKSRVRRIKEGVEFLGFVVLPDRLRLNQRNVKKMRVRMGRLRVAYRKGEADWPAVRESLQAWNAHAAHGDTWRLREEVFGRAPFVRAG